ncbi:hypothetical protein GBA52_019047 [Prunus armeniaca]|nr:hypothetical protein GBA52_019047 [Prunus armeniaca]
MLAGHIWRCACKARKLADDQDTEVFIPVSVEGPNCNPHSHLAYLAMSFSEPHQLLPLWYAASCGHNALGRLTMIISYQPLTILSFIVLVLPHLLWGLFQLGAPISG